MKKLAFLVALAAPFFAGCAANQHPTKDNWWHNHKSVSYLTKESAQQLQAAVAGQSLTLVTRSQQRYEITVSDRYFAASGRDCVNAQTKTQPIVVCEYGEEWGVSRSFSQFENSQGAQ